MALFRRYLIAGLLFWAPILVTILIIEILLRWFDKLVALIPVQYQPETFLHIHIPGLSIVIIIAILVLTGILATNVIGRFFVNFGEKIVARIPLVRTIYVSVKQLLNSIFSPNHGAFRKVLLVPYPTPGTWALAFLTGNGFAKINQQLGEELLTVFVPNAPFPTAGSLLLIPANKVIELDLTIDEALKLVISLGVVLPPPNK